MSANIQVMIPATQLPQASPRLDLSVYLEELSDHEALLASGLEFQEEEVIFQVREQAKQLVKFGWRIQCACDAALWNKTAAAKNGRGNVDIDAIGITAAVAKKAKQIDVLPRTIYNNRKIFTLMQEVQAEEKAEQNGVTSNSILDTLQEKDYYIVALSAADPKAALKMFAERKTSLPRFRPSDANRLLKAEGGTRKATALRAVDSIREDTGQLSERQALLAHIEASIFFVKERIIPGCPDEDFKERIWDDLLLSLSDEKQELFDRDAEEALVKAWKQGWRSEEDMVVKTGLPLEDVKRLLKGMGNTFFRCLPTNKALQGSYWHLGGEYFDNEQFTAIGR